MKKIILLIILLALIVTVSRVSAQEEGDGLVAVDGASAPVAVTNLIAIKFKKQLDVLNDVKLDDELFDSAAFKTLTDWSRPIPNEPSGRPNPFAPF
jgi:ABC-type phosphate transport system substrate-binding protein